MRIRKSRTATIDEILLAEIHGAILHPDLHTALLSEYDELERKGKLCRTPSMIFETYHTTMEERVAMFEESCRKRNIILEYYLNRNR